MIHQILLFPLLLASPASEGRPEPIAVERRLTVMGTEFVLFLEGPSRAAALVASEAALRALEEAQKRLSTWVDDSELARLNGAAPGFPFPLSPTLHRELSEAHRCWVVTEGAFDPGIGALLDAWGLRSGGREPSEQQRRRALQGGGLWALELSANGTATRKLPGLRLDEGAFGKGAGLDQAVKALQEANDAVSGWIDLGGQWVAVGTGPPRTLALAHPRDRRRPILELSVAAGSVATSGNSERGLEIDGERFAHLLDPATGTPSPDFGSLTVIAPTALEADCLATGLYVMGPERALGWAKGHAGVEVVVIEAQQGSLRARATSGLKDRLLSTDSELQLIFIP